MLDIIPGVRERGDAEPRKAVHELSRQDIHPLLGHSQSLFATRLSSNPKDTSDVTMVSEPVAGGCRAYCGGFGLRYWSRPEGAMEVKLSGSARALRASSGMCVAK